VFEDEKAVMTRAARCHSFLIACVMATACATSTKHSTPAESTGQESATTTKVFDRAEHMQASLLLASHARDAVIDGNLSKAKEAARALAKHDFGGTIADSWKKWIGDVRKGADDVVLAGGLDDAAQGVGAVALACGNCHYHHDAGPVQREPPVAWLDSDDTLAERMDRHSAGVEQLWIGLVAPSEEAWRAGTVTLTRAPLAPPQTQDGSVGPRAAAEIERVRNLGKRARTASTHAERAQIYGELVAGCGRCHTTTPRSM